MASLHVPDTFVPMGFNKTFFKNIGDLLQDYYKVYPCAAVSLTLRVAGEEYNVARILKADDTLLTFSFYSTSEKSQPLPPDCREKSEETIAWPALTVPYEAIFWVEFNPGRAAREREIGFAVPDNL
jgi:hypothetical protein